MRHQVAFELRRPARLMSIPLKTGDSRLIKQQAAHPPGYSISDER